jgi:hypothetical protein
MIAKPDQSRGLFGVLGSVESLAGIIGPIIGGSLAKIHPIRGPLMSVLFLYHMDFTLIYFGYECTMMGQAKITTSTDEKTKKED